MKLSGKALREAILALKEEGGDISTLLPSKAAIRAEKARRSFLEFAKNSKKDYKAGWVHEEICSQLQQFYADCKEGKSPRLMLFMPPRHGKSFLASQRFPAWVLGKDPTTEIITSSYSASLATTFSKETRDLVEDEYFKGVFPEFELGDVTKVDDWKTKQKGGYKSVGVEGSTSGYGADMFIIDDPVKGWEEAYSPTRREKVWNWYTSVAYSRLSPGAGILLILTRWHDDDLAGHILKQDKKKKWKVLKFPAISEEEEAHRQIGEPLHPERFDLDRLTDIQDTVGPRVWASLYQQKPRIDGGHHIKREWFYDKIIDANVVPDGMQWRRFWDLAVSAKSSADFTASPRCAMDKDGNFYIANMLHFKREWGGTKKVIVQTAKIEKIPIGIETVSAFEIALQEVKPLLRGVVPVRGYQVTKDKLSRALPWIDLAERGKVFLVNGPWIGDFLEECERFDPIKDTYHDDQVDGVSGGYEMVRATRNKPAII